MCSTTAFICWSSLVTLSFCPRVCTLHCTAVLSICNITTMVISAAQQLDSWSIVGELRKAYIWVFAIWSHPVSICISSNASYGVNKYIVICHICNNLWKNVANDNSWQYFLLAMLRLFRQIYVPYVLDEKGKDKSGGIFKEWWAPWSSILTSYQPTWIYEAENEIHDRFYLLFFDGEVFRDLWMVPCIGKFSCETFWGDVIIRHPLMCKEQLGPRANWFDNECI